MTGPLPLISVFTVSDVLAFAFGITTLGTLSKAPEAVTDEFAFVLELVDAAGLDEPQPAKATVASTGMARTARVRRMESSRWSMSAWPAYWQYEVVEPHRAKLNTTCKPDSGAVPRFPWYAPVKAG
jgi:hypothetical protein